MTVEIISWSISAKVWYRAGIELATPGSAVRHASVARHVTDQNKQTKTSQSIVCTGAILKDRPICCGTSPLKNGCCVNMQYALLKTQGFH